MLAYFVHRGTLARFFSRQSNTVWTRLLADLLRELAASAWSLMTINRSHSRSEPYLFPVCEEALQGHSPLNCSRSVMTGNGICGTGSGAEDKITRVSHGGAPGTRGYIILDSGCGSKGSSSLLQPMTTTCQNRPQSLSPPSRQIIRSNTSPLHRNRPASMLILWNHRPRSICME